MIQVIPAPSTLLCLNLSNNNYHPYITKKLSKKKNIPVKWLQNKNKSFWINSLDFCHQIICRSLKLQHLQKILWNIILLISITCSNDMKFDYAYKLTLVYSENKYQYTTLSTNYICRFLTKAAFCTIIKWWEQYVQYKDFIL